jgi:hypothetical protein
MNLEQYGLEPLFWGLLALGILGIIAQLYLNHIEGEYQASKKKK